MPELRTWLRERGWNCVLDPESAAYLPDAGTEGVARAEMPDRKPDLVVVLGGDGTLLAAARDIAIKRVKECVAGQGGADVEVIDSPIHGMEGNWEYLLHGRFGEGAKA